MTNPPFNPALPVQTRDGREVVIYKVYDGSDPYSNEVIHGAIRNGDRWVINDWHLNGSCFSSCLLASDLVNVPEKITKKVWLHFYEDGIPNVEEGLLFAYRSKAESDYAIRKYGHLPACVKEIEVTYTKGEGL